MRTTKVLYELRRFRNLSSVSFSFAPARSIHSQSTYSFLSPSNVFNNYSNFRQGSSAIKNSLFSTNFMFFRFPSIHTSTDNPENMDINLDVETTLESDVLTVRAKDVSELPLEYLGRDEWYDPLIRTVTSLLDGFHDLTGLPWWLTIAFFTFSLRVALLPLFVLQLKKLKRISELNPKLPPPFPPPLSGKSYIEQYLLFRKERLATGCPSYLWVLANASVQIPCFVLWMATIRRMSLDYHPGFDCGGIFWFQDLTESSHGGSGVVFPILIASLHFISVQISFRTKNVAKTTGFFGKLAKYYKYHLDFLTLPMFMVGFYIPQGSSICFISNNLMNVIQNLSLNHVAVRKKLGLPNKNAPVKSEILRDWGTLKKLSPKELLSLSVQLLAKGDRDGAIQMLRLALEKDPDYARALVVLGQTFMQKGLLLDATECFERAISKIFLIGHSTKDEEVDVLILASSWAGVTCIKQGRTLEGLEHLRRIAQLKEPGNPKIKAHYFDGLLLLASALVNEGQKDEAAKYLRIAAAYDPAYKEYLQQCLEDTDIVASNRRN